MTKPIYFFHRLCKFKLTLRKRCCCAAGEEDAPSEFSRLNACINFLYMCMCVCVWECAFCWLLFTLSTHTLTQAHTCTRTREWTRNSISCRGHGHIKCFTAAHSPLHISSCLSWPLWNLTHVAPTSHPHHQHQHRSRPLRPVWPLLPPLFHFSHVMCVIKVTKSKSYFLHWPQNLYLCASVCACVRATRQPFCLSRLCIKHFARFVQSMLPYDEHFLTLLDFYFILFLGQNYWSAHM